MMRARTLLYGLLAALQGTALADDLVCPPGYGPIDVNKISILHVTPVYVSTYVSFNGAITIGPGLTLNVTNAPTNLVTNAFATSILNEIEAALLGLLTGLPGFGGFPAITGAGGAGGNGGASATATATGTGGGANGGNGLVPGEGSDGIVTAPGIIPFSASVVPSGTDVLDPFILQVVPITQVTKRELPIRGATRHRRQSDNQGFLTTGLPTDNCQQSSVFKLDGGHLLDGQGNIYSTDSTSGALFNASTDIHTIATTFSLETGALTWTNPSFPAGSTQFCRDSTGAIFAVYDGSVPANCEEVQLGFIPAQQCPGVTIPTPTGGPYTTTFELIPGTSGHVATVPPTNGDGTTTVFYQIPTGGPDFAGPYTTLTEPGDTSTTITLAPGGSDPTGTVIVENPNAFTGPYVTITSGYGGSVTTTTTETPGPGDSTGTVIVETPTGTFTGPYTTITEGYDGSTTTTITQAPGPGDSTGTVIVETPLGTFTGPYTTITEGYGGSVTTTITQGPANGDPTGTVIVETPLGTFTGPYTTITTGYDGSVTTTITQGPANGDPTGTVIVETPRNFRGPYRTITTGYGGSVTTTITEAPAAGDSTGTVIVETPTGGSFTGPYTTITTGYSGSTTTTITQAPGAGDSTGTVIVETPTRTTATACSTVTSDPSPSCATLLPSACEDLTSVLLAGLPAQLLDCTQALGPYATGTVADCLNIQVTSSSSGTAVRTCLANALDNQCITALPAACQFANTLTGTALLNQLGPCETALGPFYVGGAVNCLASSVVTTATTGAAVDDCLSAALGLDETTTTGVCSSGTTTCIQSLPSVCTEIAGIDGLLLTPIIPVCRAALGTVGGTLLDTCVTANGVTSATVGRDLLTCLENDLC